MSIKSKILPVFALIVITCLNANNIKADTRTRIKDIINVEGIRDNLLVGYGLVVGLDGTGDRPNNSPFTEKSLQSFLSNLWIFN